MPQSKDEVAEAVAEIGRRQRERQRIEAAMNDELSQVRERFEREAQPHAEAIKACSLGVRAWCEAHRAELLGDERSKTVALASGELRWRLRPPSVIVRSADKVLEALRRLGLGRFIRTKEELSKDAILAEPAAVQHIKGISISQKEDFVIEPFETRLEEVL
jgi:phage host-nuclease inhibitor protein Gam